MNRVTAIAALTMLLTCFAYAGGEVQQVPGKSSKRYVPAASQPAASQPAAKVVSGRSIEGTGIHKHGFDIQRTMPMPAPSRKMGHGAEYNEFYGPTYYDPWHHNVWERLNPTYYPFFHPREWPNYKAPGDYCAGKICGPSSSSHYWDSYDDWKRAGRYEQRQ
ncbi:MAG: hypothetical protein ACR2IE_00060 [Candidatus Sumerlaeaceae bacterium]